MLQDFSKSLPRLTSLSLLGPFLVFSEAWIEFLRAKPDLVSFKIIQSPRFDLKCAQQLAESCTNLEELQLREVGQLDDAFVEPLCALPPLKLLDLSKPSIGIEEDGWIKLMERHGGTLEKLNTSWHGGFTDRALRCGVAKYTRVLSELSMEGCEELTDEHVAQFFANWRNPSWGDEDAMDTDDTSSDSMFTPNPPLHVLSLARNHVLSDATLTALLEHSGPTLTSLDLNGLRSLSSDALALLKCATALRRLDLSWCREVDDFVMKDIVAAMPKLEELKVWGCSRVKGTGWAGKVRSFYSMWSGLNDLCRQRGLKVYGIEPNAGR